MPDISPDKIILVEDHHQAYYAWQKNNFRRLALVHIDAHIDFGFPKVKDTRLVIKEAKSLSDLRAHLERTMLFRQKHFSPKKLTHIGNYIYPAMRDGIVNEFFWVIPGGKKEFKDSLKIIKSALKNLSRQDPRRSNKIKISDSRIQTTLYGSKFVVCCLEGLPKINRKVLLDIDTDFLVIDSLKKANATTDIARRKPWTTPLQLVKGLREKLPRVVLTTIAYSVNGGFTPMIYKTLGDEIARSLGNPSPALTRRILAGEYFKRFKEALGKSDFLTAQNNYLQACRLNPRYRTPDNNYGWLYMQIGNYREAEKEFRKMLKVDKKDCPSWAGLGRIYLVKKKLKPARSCFKRALALNQTNRPALIGLAEIESKLKNWQKARNLIGRYEKLEPMQGFSRFLLGRIYEKQRKPELALAEYKEAWQLGPGNIDILTRLVRLSLRLDRTNLSYLRNLFEDFRKRFHRWAKKSTSIRRKIKILEAVFKKEKVKPLYPSRQPPA